MTLVNYEKVAEFMINKSVPKPESGTLSGHAAGEPFDKFVYQVIKSDNQNTTFRQFEYLNDLYLKNPTVITLQERLNLFNSPSVMFLLSRGKDAVSKWEPENPFDEKQNDTADILVVDKGFYEIIDVKTRNTSKKAQPPNIISAYKLAQLCAVMLDNEEFDKLSINYIEIDWKLQENKLVCDKVYYGSLFKEIPNSLYINWAAAMQLQFHVSDLDQNYEGDAKQWAKEYLKHFVTQARERSDYMIKKFVKPFEKYIID